jgi:hypothetical protein
MIQDIALAAPGHRATAPLDSSLVFIYLLYIPYEIRNIIREYRHPRPGDLGLSHNARLLGGCLILDVALFSLVSWPISKRDNLFVDWPWFLFVWGVVLLVYIARPRASHN